MAGRGESKQSDRRQTLILLSGLHHYYRDAWARLQSSLLRVNPEVDFDVALLTWPLFTCTDRDRHPSNDECMTEKTQRQWLRCDGPLPAGENFTSVMEKFYAGTSEARPASSPPASSPPAAARLVYTQWAHWGTSAYDRPHRCMHR